MKEHIKLMVLSKQIREYLSFSIIFGTLISNKNSSASYYFFSEMSHPCQNNQIFINQNQAATVCQWNLECYNKKFKTFITSLRNIMLRENLMFKRKSHVLKKNYSNDNLK